jgi:hypothetical protein
MSDSVPSPAGPRVRGTRPLCEARKSTPSLTSRGSSATGGKRWQTCSLPCAPKRLPWVATGCGSACLSGFRAPLICHRLPPVAPAGLHECSTLATARTFSVRRGVPVRRDQVDLGDLMACRIESDEQPLPWRHRDGAFLRAGTRCRQLREEESAAERDWGRRGP